jgi:hypothetical protein
MERLRLGWGREGKIEIGVGGGKGRLRLGGGRGRLRLRVGWREEEPDFGGLWNRER